MFKIRFPTLKDKMSKAVENLQKAQKYAMSIRPKVGGFPYLAEAFRKAGISQNIWNLPSCQSIYLTKYGSVACQGAPLFNEAVEIPAFNREALIKALRIDQSGESTFPEFLKASWDAGVISYVADFEKRIVTYYGASGESYAEQYAAVDVD